MTLDKRYIAVEGVIGSGKTSLARLLSEFLNAELILDAGESNPFLEKFYEDPSRYRLQAQLFFLLSRYQQQREINQQNLFNVYTVSDYIFARDGIFARLNLSDDELKLYEDVYSLLDQRLAKPDLVVYLQAGVKTLRKRIRLRDRPMERGIAAGYIEGLCEAFNHFFFHYTEAPLLIVNTDEIDFVRNKGDLARLVDKINSHRAGVECFVPVTAS
ncbi:MAG: deoxynucleoside kinase [Nitrospinae bacterium]|nr:deoxynucleoside kinase [Nitrospinota bacterium]